MADTSVASVILEQLGGNKFLAMTGAKALTRTDRSLDVQINGRHPTAGQVNRLRIELVDDDTYTVTVYRLRKLVCNELDKKEGVFVEALSMCIESMTGLRTSL
jgi:hypothetical protein